MAFRKVMVRTLFVFGFFVLALAGLGVYVRYIEPNWIQTTQHHVAVRATHWDGQIRKVAHLSDLHTRGMGYRERKMLDFLRTEQPDVIVITGDTVTEGTTPEGLFDVLSRLKAPKGVFAVRGNWEYWIRLPQESEIYRQAGVRLLQNESVALAPGLWLVGLDDAYAGRPSVKKAMTGVPEGAGCIAFFHEPIQFDNGIANRCFLSLAGHTHGGQAKVPFVWQKHLPFGSKPYIEGWYQKDRAKLYVSRGIGTSVLPVRFLARPEIAIMHLYPETQSAP